MPRVKLVVILPVLFCGVEGLLRYWNLHSEASIPNTIGWDTPAKFISEGLNFPAAFVGVLFFMPLNDQLRRAQLFGCCRRFWLLACGT
jgi:hypothetical protein